MQARKVFVVLHPICTHRTDLDSSLKEIQRLIGFAHRRVVAGKVVEQDWILGINLYSSLQPVFSALNLPKQDQRPGAEMQCPDIIRMPLQVSLNNFDCLAGLFSRLL